MTHNLAVFMEPKGFIKIIQLLFVVISFSCICSFSGTATYNVSNNTASIHIAYPFDISNSSISFPFNSSNLPAIPDERYSSNSQFTVFVGVFSLFYCVAALLFYVLMNDFLYQDPKIRKADFVIEAVLSFLWFVGAIAWSNVVVRLNSFINERFCKMAIPPQTCVLGSPIIFSTAYIGIIASFTSMGLMLSGLWFLWKETSWARRPEASAYEAETGSQGDQSHY